MSPHSSHYSSPPHLLPLFPPPLVIVHVSFIIIPVNPSPYSPIILPASPLWSLSACSQFQCVLFHFGLLVRFVHYVLVKAEIIWYLSFTAWLISLSLMLSSSIHAVAKGRSSFFLCAALSITKKVLQCVNIPVF